MKNILITGINSYVGNNFEKWIGGNTEDYSITKISLKNNNWKFDDFSQYDVILHVAGIAHVSNNSKMEDLYYKVNRDLTYEIAKKAKSEGVKQFVFLSSIIVYGNQKKISLMTKPKPRDFYGESKLQAEKKILELSSSIFNIAIIRPPMIYGKNSKGNYLKLSKLVKRTFVFPLIYNKRSLLHIDNLTEFLKHIIDNDDHGIFFPQNKEIVSTSELVATISNIKGKKIHLISFFNPIIRILQVRINLFNKIFGDLYYDPEMSNYKKNYHCRDFNQSILLTETDDESVK
ncbi:nucleoside-diphosphate-sugar epimerase [Rossellomorea marisflavi]